MGENMNMSKLLAHLHKIDPDFDELLMIALVSHLTKKLPAPAQGKINEKVNGKRVVQHLEALTRWMEFVGTQLQSQTEEFGSREA